jgi:hypothetical protein
MDPDFPKQAGQNLNPIQNPIPQQGLQPPIQNLNQNQVQQKKSSNTKFIFLGIFIGIIILILIIVSIYFFFSSNNSKKIETNSINKINSSVDSGKDSKPVENVNIDEIDPHQLALELYEKEKKLEHIYYKKEAQLHDGQKESAEVWFYKSSIKIVEKNGVAIFASDKGVYIKENGGREKFMSIDEPIGFIVWPLYLIHMNMSYENEIKNNSSLKLLDVKKDKNNMLIYRLSYIDKLSGKNTISILENGFVVKEELEDVDTKEKIVAEAINYSFEPFPLSVFDIPNH